MTRHRNNLRTRIRAAIPISLLSLLICLAAAVPSHAASRSATAPMGIRVQFDSKDSPEDVSQSIKIVLLLTVLSLAPSIVVMTTSFVRILIVLGLLRRALGTPQSPPSQVLTALAIFLTAFIMMPIFQQINSQAIQPYMAEEISQETAWKRGIAPLREFMGRQTGESELAMFIELSGSKTASTAEEVPLSVLIPSFMMSELKTAFQMGFLIYLPFLVIDLVIASSLMSLGMMMLPPMMVSLPIKILFFVLADGWTLVVRGIVTSFSM